MRFCRHRPSPLRNLPHVWRVKRAFILSFFPPHQRAARAKPLQTTTTTRLVNFQHRFDFFNVCCDASRSRRPTTKMKTTALRVRRFVQPRGAALDARPFLYRMSNALCHASRRRASPFVLARFPRRRSSFARSTPRASSSSSNRPIVADPRRPRPALDHARARETSARAIDRGVVWANSSSAATDRKI